jgi:hypothetical protein
VTSRLPSECNKSSNLPAAEIFSEITRRDNTSDRDVSHGGSIDSEEKHSTKNKKETGTEWQEEEDVTS